MGGGFGSKLNLYSDELAVIWPAVELVVPVKWVETRTENFTAGVHARDQIHNAELALDSHGQILALRRPLRGRSRRLLPLLHARRPGPDH